MNADSTFAKADRSRGMAGGRADRGATLRETKFDELTANAAPVEQWQSTRPPLPHCTPQQFLDDLVQFLTVRVPPAGPSLPLTTSASLPRLPPVLCLRPHPPRPCRSLLPHALASSPVQPRYRSNVRVWQCARLERRVL